MARVYVSPYRVECEFRPHAGANLACVGGDVPHSRTIRAQLHTPKAHRHKRLASLQTSKAIVALCLVCVTTRLFRVRFE